MLRSLPEKNSRYAVFVMFRLRLCSFKIAAPVPNSARALLHLKNKLSNHDCYLMIQEEKMSPGTKEVIETEISQMLNDAYKRASNIIKTHR